MLAVSPENWSVRRELKLMSLTPVMVKKKNPIMNMPTIANGVTSRVGHRVGSIEYEEVATLVEPAAEKSATRLP